MERNIEFVCFTGAAGGSGCTSAAIACARVLARLFSKRVLILSFDLLSCKMAPNNVEKYSVKRLLVRLLNLDYKMQVDFNSCFSDDDFGVSYLNDKSFYNPLHGISSEDLRRLLEAVSRSELFDVVLLDLPFRYFGAEEVLSYCEKTVVVGGWTEGQNKANKQLYSYLEKCIKELRFRPEIKYFEPLKDDESFEDGRVDIHGQFGAEVRQLVSELFEGL